MLNIKNIWLLLSQVLLLISVPTQAHVKTYSPVVVIGIEWFQIDGIIRILFSTTLISLVLVIPLKEPR